MSEFPPCPQCKSIYTYESGNFLACPECGHEWSAEEVVEEETISQFDNVVKDSNGVILQNGDTVIIVKDLPVKGFPRSIKSGTKVKNIRLNDSNDGHNIDCKVDEFGAMALKSEFVRKA